MCAESRCPALSRMLGIQGKVLPAPKTPKHPINTVQVSDGGRLKTCERFQGPPEKIWGRK